VSTKTRRNEEYRSYITVKLQKNKKEREGSEQGVLPCDRLRRRMLMIEVRRSSAAFGASRQAEGEGLVTRHRCRHIGSDQIIHVIGDESREKARPMSLRLLNSWPRLGQRASR